MGGGGRRAARGGLQLSTGLFGGSMCLRSAIYSHKPMQTSLEGLRDVCVTNTGATIRPTYTSHLVPSTGPIIPVMTSHGRQNQF